ncbi:MAG: D-alanyl-D-alanine carboxypeptidase family protein [Proteobacteria bacterium]|nr:MAG: D-alanyl-D-alanine carboxypeptidase family protein [Pseudomonadota bacterium]
MFTITTPRLCLQPTHKNCWSIRSKTNQDLLGKVFFHNHWFNIILKPKSLHLGVASEAGYGLIKALNSQTVKAKSELPHARLYLKNLGFEQVNNHFEVTPETLLLPDLYQRLNQQLGINTEHIKAPQYPTATQVVDAGVDCFQRPIKLHPRAFQAWQAMQQAAANEAIQLIPVSAFRSLNYQAELIQKKLDQGQQLDAILKVNTPPGHSEHHTGCALDLTTAGEQQVLESNFAHTDAYHWLKDNAAEYGFYESYPEGNPHGIMAEPWHWCMKDDFNNRE